MQPRHDRGPVGRRTKIGAPCAGRATLALAAVGITMAFVALCLGGRWGDGGLSAARRAYTVSQARNGLLWQPRAWLGRTVRMRAIAAHESRRYCPDPIATCVGVLPIFVDGPGATATALPLVWGGSDRIRAQLRRLPLIAPFVSPQVPQWGRLATYLVSLRLAAGPTCHTCFVAVLVDASPVEGL